MNMDVLRPELFKVGSRIYRKNPTKYTDSEVDTQKHYPVETDTFENSKQVTSIGNMA